MGAIVDPAFKDTTEQKPTGRTLSSLHTRNFRLFFIGQTVSNTGNWLTNVALTLLILHRTHSGVAVGVLGACQLGPILVVSPWAGVIIDRTVKRRLLIITQTLEMGESFALGALAFAHHAPVVAFYLVAAAGGVLLAVDNPVRRTFVNEMVPLDHLSNAVSLNSAMVNVARIVGPALAGVLVVSAGYGWCFTIDAISYAAVLVGLLMIRSSELRPAVATPRGRGQLRAGLRYVTEMPELRVTFLMLFIIGTVSYNFTVVVPLFVEQGLHGSDTSFTLVYSAFSAGAFVGAMLVARRPTISVGTVTIGAALLGVSMIGLSVVPSVLVAAIVIPLVGGTSVAYMTATLSIAQLRTEPQMVGRVVSLQAVLIGGTTPIGAPLLGWLSDSVGARAPVYVGGIAAFVAAAVGWVFMRRVSRL